jgi:aminopeptidase YwaD
MKSLLFLLISILAVPCNFSQDLEFSKAIIQKLTSAEFKGRGYVENGDKLSADFVAEEYKSLGLLPLNKDSYFQKFTLSVNTFPNRVMLKLNDIEMKAATDFLVEADCPSVYGKFRIQIMTRGQIATDEQLISLIHKSRDSFIFIDNRKNKNEKPEIGKKTDQNIQLLKYTANLPIKGILIYSEDKLTWESSPVQNVRPIVILNRKLDPDTLHSIEIIVDAKFKPKYETQNVVGILKGISGSDSTIVVVAHYDHLGKMGKDVYFPGANDNASGVAMLLNLAKHYSENKPKYTMYFIALSGEELGLLGAKYLVENPPIDLSKIKFLVNFDIAGTGDEGIKIVNGSVYKDKFDRMNRINQQQQLLPKIEIRGAACNSDHCMFYNKGVPCFYIYTLGGIQAYHDIYDRYETLPLTRFVDYCKLMICFFDSL